MIYRLKYTEPAKKDICALDKLVIKRILDKIDFYITQRNPLQYAKKLSGSLWGMYRFRIGDYRAIFDLNEDGQIIILLILRVKHRRDVYNI